MSLTGGKVSIEKTGFEDDFKRESAFLSCALENIKNSLENIKSCNFEIGRPLERKGGLFNQNFDDPEAQKPIKLKKKSKKNKPKNKPEFIFAEKDDENTSKYKTHVKVRENNKYKENSSNLKKKRPGKRARELKRIKT